MDRAPRQRTRFRYPLLVGSTFVMAATLGFAVKATAEIRSQTVGALVGMRH